MNEELNRLIYIVLCRYKEVFGKRCFTEQPRTDLQESMQALEKYYRQQPHNTALKSDAHKPCECGHSNPGEVCQYCNADPAEEMPTA